MHGDVTRCSNYVAFIFPVAGLGVGGCKRVVVTDDIIKGQVRCKVLTRVESRPSNCSSLSKWSGFAVSGGTPLQNILLWELTLLRTMIYLAMVFIIAWNSILIFRICFAHNDDEHIIYTRMNNMSVGVKLKCIVLYFSNSTNCIIERS